MGARIRTVLTTSKKRCTIANYFYKWNMENNMTEKMTLPKLLWWNKGECVVEILSRGHFPTTAMVKLPSDKKIEIDIDELRIEHA